MELKETVRSESFIRKFGIGKFGSEDLLSIFQYTADKMISNKEKCGNLLFPLKPREVDARQIMCEILSAKNLNHMIECPIHSPTQKMKSRSSFVDLSIFSNDGIIDIEFKKSPSDINRDFPKLLSSGSLGCASFYLFNGKIIENQLPLIKDRYREAYENTLNLTADSTPLLNKWYIFYLLALEEKRIFYKAFHSIQELNFSSIIEKSLQHQNI